MVIQYCQKLKPVSNYVFSAIADIIAPISAAVWVSTNGVGNGHKKQGIKKLKATALTII
jgi:hypothetical protein